MVLASMTEEAPAGSSEGATWALRHRKALASALFVLAAIAALKAPGLRITALFVFLLGASLLIAEASPEATGESEGGSAGDALGSLPGVRAVEAASRSDDEDASAYFRSLLSHHRSAAKVAWWGAVLAIWLGQVPAATVLALARLVYAYKARPSLLGTSVVSGLSPRRSGTCTSPCWTSSANRCPCSP